MLFVLRLVVAPRGQGYRATLCELWKQCAAAGVELPQDEPPAASTACDAREKLDERAFKALHREILANNSDGRLWKDHRVLAVDGSKLTLPRELAQRGYRIPDGAHYPQGMVSAMYRRNDRIPVDFDLFRHDNKRSAALTHLDHAAEGRCNRLRPRLFLVRDGPGPLAARTALRVPHCPQHQPHLRRVHRLAGNRPDPRPPTAQRRPARPKPPHPPGQVCRRRHRILPRHLPARQPDVFPSRRSATSITADGESRNSTRPARP